MPQNALQKRGTVQAFNISPKGAYEGLLLQTKNELIQINFLPEFSAELAALASQGNDIQAEVESQEVNGHACHPVYRLLRVTNPDRERFSAPEGNIHKNEHFSGTVERLNYALHGEVNGAILQSGDFLHVKPHGAVALELTIGMKVKGIGSTKPMLGGHRVIEADEVNGIRLEKKSRKKTHK